MPVKRPKPAKDKPERKKRKHRRTPLTPEELDRFFKVCTNARDACIFRLMVHRGLRASEIGLLAMEDWNPITGRLNIFRQKGSLETDYPLKPVEIKALQRYLRVRRGTTEKKAPLFPSRKGGELGLSRWPIFHLMRKYCALAKISPAKAHPHSMKHTTGTLLADEGADLLDIKDRLGHSDVRSTMEYIADTDKRRNKFAEKTKTWKI